MDYFKTIGESLSARCGDGALGEDFPELAAAALAEFPVPAGMGIAFMADWALGREELPEQVNFNSGFGEPPLVVYEEPRFYAEVLFWFHGRTAIHSHGFCGAFQVLAGYSMEAEFLYHPTPGSEPGIQLGELEPMALRLIAPGEITRILPEEAFIHTVMHMGSPSLTLVIRNKGGPTQFDYALNGLRVNAYQHAQTYARQAEVLSAFHEANPDAFAARLLEFLGAGSAHRMARILKELEQQLDEEFLTGELRDLAVQRFGALGEAMIESVTRSLHGGEIWNEVAAQEDPAVQLRTALLDLFPDEKDLLAVVGRTFPDRDPAEVLENWAEQVSEMG
ncbi:hypothetical protein [Synoicihabitans lomoniglobus]|uniref:Uncharacterized protein n=1 Tax=Synoicihabitans lomoniglobus TaxID=2909285 RepID=A0AAF0I379_9BACT|nr:hypothetical protein [Opitutaceae bacterium LMO-M01]WED65969.1 hypothetical protein PXH66_03785 [Opitutaceae bacterium LMO-M01]